MTPDLWEEIESAIWKVEIGLDTATCRDGGQDEETKAKAESLLGDATRLRKRLIRAFGETNQITSNEVTS